MFDGVPALRTALHRWADMPEGSKYRGQTFGHADGRRCRLSTWRAANKADEIEMPLEAGQPNCDTLVEAHEAWPVRQL
jgi:hypothetical protein